MKSNRVIIITAVIAMVIGLVAGYLIFGKGVKAGNSDLNHEMVGEVDSLAKKEIWTCSMHPQIRQNEPGDCPICGMDLIRHQENSSNDPLVLEMTNEAIKLANIQTTIIGEEIENVGKSIPLSGKVQADERLAASQVAHIPGRIEKLYVSFTGEQVIKGQRIATMYSPELIAAQRELVEALSLMAINPGLVEAARNKLRYWKIDNTTIEDIEKNRTIQETFTVFADKSGIVTNRRVAVGDYVKQGESLFDLMNLNRVWVLFDAYEGDLPAIKVGNNIEFTTPSVPNKTFRTQVTFIDPVINARTRVASVRAEVNNSGGMLKPEMLVQGTLKKIPDNKSQLTVPKSAVLWTGTRSVVYVKVPDMVIPSFKFKEIEIGESLGSSYQVFSGLEPGDEVVTYGSFTIDAAAQLNNQSSMMNRMVSEKGITVKVYLPDYTESTPLEFKQQLVDVADAYLLLKDALVATDRDMTIASTPGVIEALLEVDMSMVKGDAHLYWMEQFESLKAHTEKITELTDVEEQRKQFDFLSQALIKSIKAFGVSEDTLYVQHCPMVNNNKGADWISKEKEVQNPYFGDKMMTCGVVKAIIDKDFKNSSINRSASPRPQVQSH
jgi:Cu(I)/Ag(I) efflux system membrane fusion protein